MASDWIVILKRAQLVVIFVICFCLLSYQVNNASRKTCTLKAISVR